MSTQKQLLETVAFVGDPSDDGTWRVRIISEGKGSSGVYTKELLENHFSAFDNVLSFKNHPVGWDGPQSRDFTMIAGEIVGKTWTDVDERGLTAVYGNYRPDDEYKDKLARYRDKLGLSVYIEGSGYEDENGQFIVDWFNPNDPYASVDVVIAPGARGKFMESMQRIYSQGSEQKPGGTSPQEKEKNDMDEKLVERFETAVTSLVSVQERAAEQKQVSVDAEALSAAKIEAVEAFDAARKLIDAAEGLLPVQREALFEAAKRGEDVAPVIEQAKTVAEQAKAAVIAEAESDGARSFGVDSQVAIPAAWKVG